MFMSNTLQYGGILYIFNNFTLKRRRGVSTRREKNQFDTVKLGYKGGVLILKFNRSLNFFNPLMTKLFPPKQFFTWKKLTLDDHGVLVVEIFFNLVVCN